ncbi:AAA family ATPase [Kitasatospora aburaviensis]
MPEGAGHTGRPLALRSACRPGRYCSGRPGCAPVAPVGRGRGEHQRVGARRGQDDGGGGRSRCDGQDPAPERRPAVRPTPPTTAKSSRPATGGTRGGKQDEHRQHPRTAAVPGRPRPATAHRPHPHLDRIAELADRARAGAGGALLVTGAAGTGRSALLAEAARRAAAGGTTVLWARCSADESDTPTPPPASSSSPAPAPGSPGSRPRHPRRRFGRGSAGRRRARRRRARCRGPGRRRVGRRGRTLVAPADPRRPPPRPARRRRRPPRRPALPRVAARPRPPDRPAARPPPRHRAPAGHPRYPARALRPRPAPGPGRQPPARPLDARTAALLVARRLGPYAGRPRRRLRPRHRRQPAAAHRPPHGPRRSHRSHRPRRLPVRPVRPV